MFLFEVTKKLHKARRSRLTTPHGIIDGPFFQFVATNAAIRGMTSSEDLEKMGVQIVLANTYHLHLRPGDEIIRETGGLHGFMQWNKPITTDSGGYQVFSLGNNVKVDDDGVTFQSPLDGKKHRFTPEKVIEIERNLGADLIMPLDVCTPFGASHEQVQEAIIRTTQWAKRCKASFTKDGKQALYGIVQGGVYPDLRELAAQQLREIGFFGYSIGGELREGKEKKLKETVPATTKHLPEDAPRYLMGYGTPEDIVEAVRAGVDHFDCVLPIRNGRHGQLFYDLNEKMLQSYLQDPEIPIDPAALYSRIDITSSKYSRDYSMFSPDHPVLERKYTKSYVHHLMRTEIPSGMRFTVLHNIWFYVRLMRLIRATIEV